MSTITVTQITDTLRQLPPEKLAVAYDFIAYLAAQGKVGVPENAAKSETPTAILLPLSEYEKLVTHHRQKSTFYDFAWYLGREIEERNLTEAEFMAELEKSKHAAFTKQYGLNA